MNLNTLIALAAITLVCAMFVVSVFFIFKKSLITFMSLSTFAVGSLCILITYSLSSKGIAAIYIAMPLCIMLSIAYIAIGIYFIQSPLKYINKNIRNIAKGKLSNEIEELLLNRKDEIGILANSINVTQIELHKTAEFAKSISDRNFDNNSFQPLSTDDEIGNLLVEMRNNLIENEKQEAVRKKEEHNRNYITTGIAKFSETLQLTNVDTQAMGDKLISEMVDYVNACQGAIYMLKCNDHTDENCLELMSAVAYDRHKKIDANFKIGDSLVGRCAFEKKSIYMTDIPDNYIKITSGLGTANPRNLLLVPAIIEGKVIAVIELSSFYAIEEQMIQLIEKISENIASTFNASKNNRHTLMLLEESKKYSEEMAAQEEELRQNIEELEATQEEMKRKEEQLRAISQQLDNQELLIKEKITQLKFAN